MDNTAVIAICGAVLGSGGIAALLIYLLSRRTTEANLTAQTGLTDAQKREVDERSASTILQRDRDQETFWRGLLKETEDRCNQQVAGVKTELEVLESYVDLIIPWSWGTIRDLEMNRIPYEKPPSLADVRIRIRGTTDPSIPARRPPPPEKGRP